LLFQAVIFRFSIRGFSLARELRRLNLFLRGAISAARVSLFFAINREINREFSFFWVLEAAGNAVMVINYWGLEAR